MRVPEVTFKVMGRELAMNEGHLPAMRRRAVSIWGKGHFQRRMTRFKGMQQGSINASFAFARDVWLGSSAPMNATVMAGASRGKGWRIIYGLSHGFNMLFQVLFRFNLLFLALLGLGSSSKPPAIPPTLVVVSSTHPFVFMYGLSPSVWSIPTTVLGLTSAVMCSNSALGKEALFGPVVMPRLRQRMLSRRGTSRGAFTRPSHNERASFLRPGQFLDTSSPGPSSSPSFGSAIFTFNSSLNRPRISAHVLVLFIEEAQDEGESNAHREEMPIAGSTRDMKTPIAGPTRDMETPLNCRFYECQGHVVQP